MGSPATSRKPASRDALFVERMKGAGAIAIGKSNTRRRGGVVGAGDGAGGPWQRHGRERKLPTVLERASRRLC